MKESKYEQDYDYIDVSILIEILYYSFARHYH